MFHHMRRIADGEMVPVEDDSIVTEFVLNEAASA